MRPLYETQQDLQNEVQAIQAVGDAWGCEFFKLPISYVMDFAAIRGGDVVGFVEVRTRKNTSTQYPTIMFSLNKYLKAQEYADVGLSTILLVQYTDAIKYLDITEKHDRLVIGGRNHLRDSADIEPVVHFNTDRMRTL